MSAYNLDILFICISKTFYTLGFIVHVSHSLTLSDLGIVQAITFGVPNNHKQAERLKSRERSPDVDRLDDR